MALALRSYQEEIIDKLLDALNKGFKRPFVQLPCGGGKTSIFSYFTEQFSIRGAKVWFLVHRRELIDQTIATFKRFEVPMENVYVGMVQSAMKMHYEPDIIIFDEAHMSYSKTWRKVIDKYPNAIIIGTSATPKRTDGSPLNEIYDDLIQGVQPKWLIENKYLSEFDYYAPKIGIDYSEIKTRGSDYDMDSTTTHLLTPKIYGEIEKYLDPTKKTIVYAPSIKFSKKLEEDFPWVKHVDGETPKEEREEMVNKFKRGEIMGLTNVNLFAEGLDIPDAEVCLLLRPTQSTILYIQQSMRVLRYVEGKRAVIYDLVGNVFTHGLPDEEREWSLEGKLKRPKLNEADEIRIRMCDACLRVYEGKNRICPYCGNDNGKTRAEIARDEKVELEKIESLKKKKAKMEVGMAQSLEELIAIGVSRGYANPRYWAMQVIHSRKSKLRRR